MLHRSLPLLLLSASLMSMVACGDTDGDGLSNSRERRLGTDPEKMDTDGDGLRDGRELELGTDPLVADSDGDGYDDGDEMHFGSDPLDAASFIYVGGWPYNRDKDDIVDPGFEGRAKKNEVIGRYAGVDQYGEQVDLYDFAGKGKPIIIDISAEWCGPCRQMAEWLEGGSMQGMQQYEPIRDAIESGDLYWITVVTEDTYGLPATEITAARWADDFPNDKIPVIADDNGLLTDYFRLGFFPSTYLIDENMVYVQGPSMSGWTPAMDVALGMLE